VPQYVVGAPLFKKATLTLESGKKIVINAPANSDGKRYVRALKVNGKPYENNWLGHAALMQGAVLDFDMSDKPNTQRATAPASAPYSLSTEGAR
jgi:putative alpha-1,2-mannosidase